ncbi:asparagine synthase (glutamine-hydrolyzing), partial [bacterium]|nr:asparagine synthase (glutamine-hydrolyzing) [bacterium]
QPMSNEDGTVWIVCNGEIYNYRELTRSLSGRGHRFRSHSDTETILHLYEEYGTGCLSRLRGMFSFAIWDERDGSLFAAVDRFRIKPFYYSVLPHAFLFGSEIKALTASGWIEKKINMSGIHHMLSMQGIPAPATVYEDVLSLPGGHMLLFKQGSVRVTRYWDIQFQVDNEQDEAYIVRRLREKLQESVQLHLMSDVPLGAFLSGGVDSSLIVALMRTMQDGPVRTFSVGYDVGGRDYDDLEYARQVSKKYGTDHSETRLAASDIWDSFRPFLQALDQPSTDAINSYLVSRDAAKDVTVVLSGQGGDEFFAGYNSFELIPRFMAREAHWRRIPAFCRRGLGWLNRNAPPGFGPASLRRSLARLLYSEGSFVRKYGIVRMDLNESEKLDLYTEQARRAAGSADTEEYYQELSDRIPESAALIDRISYMDLKTLLEPVYFRDMDVMSMAFSLETRVPLSDHVLAEFAATIPPHLKIKGGRKKSILIEAVKDLLPEEIIRRPKMGFALPFPIWLRQELRPLIELVLTPQVVQERGWFKPEAVERIKQTFFAGQDFKYRRVWGLVILECWLRLVHEQDTRFFDRLDSQIRSHLKNRPSFHPVPERIS